MMPYISEEQLERIKQIDVLSYLERCKPSELVKINSRTYCTKEHDSLKISNGKWYWWSRGFGGKNALDYIVNVEGLDFYDAANYLADNFYTGYVKPIEPKSRTPPEPEKDLLLPEKADNNNEIIRYLTQRGISRSVIDYCIRNNFIYQSAYRNNLVFVGFNSSHEPKYVSIRGTGEERYFREPKGSDKTYSFRITDSKNSELHLFEGAIDLLSYATILERNGKNFSDVNMISLGGINSCSYKLPDSIEKYLSENEKIKTVYLHFDNDEPGKKATENFIKLLSGKYKTVDSTVPFGKDVNEYLQLKIKEERSDEEMKYDITISEKLEKTFLIEADSLEEAKEIAEDNYYKAEDGYVLGGDNCSDFMIDGQEHEHMIEIKIYQINADRDINSVCFERYSMLSDLQNSGTVDSSIYDKVYEGEVNASNLEDIYRIFNIDHPEDYKGRSMSVSDVVEIVSDDKIGKGFYYCDAIGFRKIDFNPTETKDKINYSDTIRVVYLEPGKTAEIRDIDSSLEGMQDIVGGYIEAGYYFRGPECIVCNDEGKLNGMNLNRGIYDDENQLVDIIAGPAFICDCSGENFCSLDEARLNKYFEQFKYPEEFFRINGEMKGMRFIPEKESRVNEVR